MTQPFLFPVSTPTLQRRRVLFAVALIDPITGVVVSEGMRVSVDKLVGSPIVNRSGYFVWLAENGVRPTTVTIESEGAPFEHEPVAIPQLPEPPPESPDLPVIFDAGRLLRIALRPTAAYPFRDSAIVLRGNIVETPTPGAPAVKGARVVLEYFAEAENPLDSPEWFASSVTSVTDGQGEFATPLVLSPAAWRRVRVETPPGKDVSVHLRFERGGSAGVSGDMDLPLAASNSIIRQGNCWILKNSFAWSDLTPA